MKIEVDAGRVLGTLVVAGLIAAFTWMWNINDRITSLESPEALAIRVKTIEDLIFPMAVEYEVRKRLGEETADSTDGSESEGTPPSMWVPPNTAVQPDPKVLKAAEDDVRSLIEQRPLEDARKRRGEPIKLKKTKK